MKNSKQLLAFYEWWIEGGNEELPVLPSAGLCYNLYRYLNKYVRDGFFVHRRIRREMQSQFRAQRLNVVFPFNDGEYAYRDEVIDNACNKNEKRIAFVQERIAAGAKPTFTEKLAGFLK